jgi:hypothetical protein
LQAAGAFLGTILELLPESKAEKDKAPPLPEGPEISAIPAGSHR